MNKQLQINSMLKFVFLFLTFIYLIKQENETYTYIDVANYDEKTATGFIVDPDASPDSPFYRYFSTSITQTDYSPVTHVNFSINRLILKFSLNHSIENFYDQSLFLSPHTLLIKILHKNNIFHQSPDDKPAPLFYC